MTVIQATSRGVKGTLADGTVRFMVEVDPAFANDAFALFGMPGSPLVIARLTPEAAIAATQAETVAADTSSRAADDKPKGGELARLAGMFCNDPAFIEWACGSGVRSAEKAAETIRGICFVKSRAELDHNDQAASIFHELIRRPYVEWRKTRGLG